jgi:hypothetical protein
VRAYEVYDINVPEMTAPVLAGVIEVDDNRVVVRGGENTYKAITDLTKEKALDLVVAKTVGGKRCIGFHAVEPGEKDYLAAFEQAVQELGFVLVELE